jgi:hypothetical protein
MSSRCDIVDVVVAVAEITDGYATRLRAHLAFSDYERERVLRRKCP